MDASVLAIARACAAALNAERDPKEAEKEPHTDVDMLEWALLEGLIATEKLDLGTRSLDHSVRPWESGDDYPRTTGVMLALVKAVGG